MMVLLAEARYTDKEVWRCDACGMTGVRDAASGRDRPAPECLACPLDAPRCAGTDCGMVAVEEVWWPTGGWTPYCARHAAWMRRVADAMGLGDLPGKRVPRAAEPGARAADVD